MNFPTTNRRSALKKISSVSLACFNYPILQPITQNTLLENGWKSGHIKANDGVNIHYLEAGSGKTLLMIPGFSQTAELFTYQINGLKDRYRVIALDMRGHGDSEKPDFGYKISRLSKDVHDVIVGLNLKNITLLGHSMGSSVIWSYWELFGADRLSKLIFVDQSPVLLANPVWSVSEQEAFGTLVNCENFYGIINSPTSSNHVEEEKRLKDWITSMVTKEMPEKQIAWMVEQNNKFDRKNASKLLYDHFSQDWRDTIRRIKLPTLIIGGKASLVPWKSQLWIHEQISGSQIELFESNEGGSHFMFIEGAEKFNALLKKFIG